MKNIGAVPKNKPIVVNPNASPGLSLYILVSNASVIAIVIEKNITPINETTIKSSPKHKNGIATSVLNIPTFLIPYASDKIPPKHFPIPMVTNSITV